MIKRLAEIFKKKPIENPQGPLFRRQRYPCPFYGFAGFPMAGLFLNQNGNQCGLMENGKVCGMEHCPSGPDWKECAINNPAHRDDISKVFEGARIGAEEFRPPNAKSWQGIPMKTWVEYVMDPGTPRPAMKTSETTAVQADNH